VGGLGPHLWGPILFGGRKEGGGCCAPFAGAGTLSNTMFPGPRSTSVLSGNVAWVEAYLFTKWHLDPSSSIQPFGHNCMNATLLRVGIPLRTIFIPSLVVKTFTVRLH